MGLNIVVVSTILFIAIYLTSYSLFDGFLIDRFRVSVFMPSGAMVFLALVFETRGIIGVALGTLLISFFYLSEHTLGVSTVLAFLTGSGLYFARKLSACALDLHVNLRAITINQIAYIIVIFSSINTLISQTFYYVIYPENDFLLGFAENLISNLLGAFLVLWLIRIAVHIHLFIFKKI
jgi:hypothetical protein